ncbi:hypothetical protein MAR_033020 [Mya arenaria]|uniref:Uncharacterized protein n=1 Tax=Mya arenaria TaxID=6604 RepID=A0ABY7G7T5_MYAAR|nr:hypothetical protein MAR_033020 [Mya arenaria]
MLRCYLSLLWMFSVFLLVEAHSTIVPANPRLITNLRKSDDDRKRKGRRVRFRGHVRARLLYPDSPDDFDFDDEEFTSRSSDRNAHVA